MYRIRAVTASGTSASSFIGCLQADVAKQAGLQNNHQQSLPTHCCRTDAGILTAVTHTLNVFRTHVVMDIFSDLV
jgi:hypothetical protein